MGHQWSNKRIHRHSRRPGGEWFDAGRPAYNDHVHADSLRRSDCDNDGKRDRGGHSHSAARDQRVHGNAGAAHGGGDLDASLVQQRRRRCGHRRWRGRCSNFGIRVGSPQPNDDLLAVRQWGEWGEHQDGGNHCGSEETSEIGTLAGHSGIAGSSDGSSGDARFRTPSSIAVDSKGNTIVADRGNNTIRWISAAGQVETRAGNAGQTGSKDGKGADALFHFGLYGGGVATDGAGNIYVSDTTNNTLRKVTADGTVTTIAGSATNAPGFADGPAAHARFNNPTHLVVDPKGVIYVADTSNHIIRKITVDGVVSTIAGAAGLSGYADGPNGLARFNLPHGLTIDATGNLYVGDVGNNAVRKITPDGIVTTLVGGPAVSGNVTTTASTTTVQFNFGCCGGGLAIDTDGNVYVADRGSQTIRRVTPEGVVSTVAGSGLRGGTDAPAQEATFNNPIAVAVDNTGRLYIADTDNHAIRDTVAPSTRRHAVVHNHP